VADGGTITHGLAATPTSVICTPSTAGEFVSVTAKTATTFTVAIKSTITQQELHKQCTGEHTYNSAVSK
jgi:hypothetical protein